MNRLIVFENSQSQTLFALFRNVSKLSNRKEISNLTKSLPEQSDLLLEEKSEINEFLRS